MWRRFPPVGQYLNEADGWKVDGADIAGRWWTFLGALHHTEVAVATHGSQAVVIDAHPLGELIGCPWCCSPYVAMGVFAARRLVPSVWDPLARVLAASAVAGVIASH